MDIKTITTSSITVSIIQSDDVIITDGQTALDLVASTYYNTDCNCIIINKQAICDDFFKLSTGIAGEVLQKMSNYKMRFAIVGDFSKYTSKPLKDFIYECNRLGHVLFAETTEDATRQFTEN